MARYLATSRRILVPTDAGPSAKQRKLERPGGESDRFRGIYRTMQFDNAVQDTERSTALHKPGRVHSGALGFAGDSHSRPAGAGRWPRRPAPARIPGRLTMPWSQTTIAVSPVGNQAIQ